MASELESFLKREFSWVKFIKHSRCWQMQHLYKVHWKDSVLEVPFYEEIIHNRKGSRFTVFIGLVQSYKYTLHAKQRRAGDAFSQDALYYPTVQDFQDMGLDLDSPSEVILILLMKTLLWGPFWSYSLTPLGFCWSPAEWFASCLQKFMTSSLVRLTFMKRWL